MIIREAIAADVSQMQTVRNAVKENKLTDPSVIDDQDYIDFLSYNGKGWVAVIDDQITGFAFADIINNNIWALFVHPDHEGKGIGRSLHEVMLDWYFYQSIDFVWLGTAPHTRAEIFYRRAGWIENGKHGKSEIKFEMSSNEWYQLRKQ